jgi:hypothetical protein
MKATRKRQLKFLAKQALELNLGYSDDQILLNTYDQARILERL